MLASVYGFISYDRIHSPKMTWQTDYKVFGNEIISIFLLFYNSVSNALHWKVMKPHMHVRMISNEGCITGRKCTRFYGFRKSFGIFRDFLEFLGLLYRGRLFKARLALTLVVYRCMSVQGAIIRVLTQGLSEKFGGPIFPENVGEGGR